LSSAPQFKSPSPQGAESPIHSPQNAESQFKIRPLRREQLPPDTIQLTRFLIGKVVVHDLPCGRLSGRVVEAEAYPPGDPAGHHFRGPTPRIRSMYQAPGHAYVYFNYGAHFMLNVSSEPEGTAGGILIRAIEPLDGVEWMQRHRQRSIRKSARQTKEFRLVDITRGPGRVAAALQIDRRHDGIDLCAAGSPLWLGELLPQQNASNAEASVAQKRVAIAQKKVARTVRIGISRAADKLLRFYERGNPFVSGPKRLLQPAKKKIASSAAQKTNKTKKAKNGTHAS
jgi:DNA-3-methyladenine glycosylase